MSQPLALVGSFAVGAPVALAAFALVHREPRWAHALLAGLLCVAVVAAVRRSWSQLPGYVGAWLDPGVAVVVALLAVVAHGASLGIPFLVLRAPELGVLFGGAALLGAAVAGLAYTHLRLAAEVAEQEHRLAELQRAALENRLAVLSAQINPHFLFNTLNTLAEVVHEDEDAAEDLVTDLAGMMRYALRSSTRRVPLTEELEVVERLLRIEKARLGDRLSWTIEGRELLAESDVYVPGLLVQPLVENAVKHGVASRAEGGTVSVTVSREPHAVILTVADDGPGLPEDVVIELATGESSLRGTEGHGGGLRNCRERVRLGWPDGTARLRHDRERPGTCLILEIPLETA